MADLWKSNPLYEAASKGKFRVECRVTLDRRTTAAALGNTLESVRQNNRKMNVFIFYFL